MNASSRTAEMKRQILSYFVRNPLAVDSLEGIVRWRLLEETIHRSVVETQEALRWLVNEGYLSEVAQPHSARMFRLNPEKLREAESFLTVSAKPDPDNETEAKRVD